MRAALDPVPLLKHLEEHGVEYIVIGGLAVAAHGHVRPSMDLDIVPGPSQENLTRLAEALVNAKAVDADADAGAFGQAELPMSTTRVDDLMQGNLRLVTDLGDLDVFQWAGGIETDDLYAELDREALTGSVEGVSVRVCGLEHLRAMKLAAGRPQDLQDLRRLGEE